MAWDGVVMPAGALYGHAGDGHWAYFGAGGELLPPCGCWHYTGDHLDRTWELRARPQRPTKSGKVIR